MYHHLVQRLMLNPTFRYSSLLEVGKHIPRARTDPLGCSAKRKHSPVQAMWCVCAIVQCVHKYKEQTLPLTLMSVHICMGESLLGDAYSFYVHLEKIIILELSITYNCEMLCCKVSLSVYFFFFFLYKTTLETSRQ